MGAFILTAMFKVVAFLLCVACVPAAAEPVRTPHVTAELVSEFETVRPGEAAWVALRLETQPHWHTYWQYPGDSGLPTRAQWKVPDGWKISDIHWPLPERIPLPPLLNLGYEEQALLLFRLEIPASASAGDYDLSAKANWLVCKEECVPEQADLRLRLKVSPAAPRPLPLRAAFEKVRAQQPVELPAGVARSVRIEEKRVGLVLASETVGVAELDFFPLIGQIVTGHAPKAERAGEETILWMDKAVPFSDQVSHLEGVLVQKHGAVFSVKAPIAGASAPSAAPVDAVRPSLVLSILFAFLGGVLLNLMPCVFPVLGIKVMSLVSQGGADRWHSRVHGKIYALGVLVSFWILTALLLALRAAGESVGWGFQLQAPGFVLFLTYLFTMLTLNLAGAFEFGGRWVGMGSGLANRDGYAGSFFTGVLAVVVATPCTAPFMGTAISVVLAEPAWAVFAVFSSLALGLAAPFVLLAYQPKLLARMPKPGLWMARLKEFFAFPLAATVLWLLWVLGRQKGVDAAMGAAFAILLLVAAIWARRFRSLPGKVATIFLVLLSLTMGGLLLVLPGLSAAAGQEAAAKDWAPYSEDALAAARAAGRPVFVDFTAAWCLTCQVNKAVVLERAAMGAFFRERNVALFRADWTNNDPVITAALERQGRIGVPVYLVYRPGEEAKVLPQILTESIVRDAF